MANKGFNLLIVLCFSLYSSAETLIKDFGNESPSMQIKSNEGFEQIEMTTDAGKYEVMKLENPTRLVIDLYGGEEITNSNTPISGSAFVQKIRSAKHDDKSRVVFDMSSNKFAQSVEQKDGKVFITLAPSETQLTIAKNSFGAEAPTMLAKNTIPAESEETVEATEETEEPTEEVMAATSETSETEEETELAKDKPILEAVNVETDNGTNKLLANLSEATTYTFGKTSPSEYLLTLEGTTLGSGVEDSIVSQQGEGEIRSVRALPKGDNVQLRIIATPDTVLKAEFEENTLFIQQVEGADNATRAQALIADPSAKPTEVKNLLAEDTKAPKVLENDLKPVEAPNVNDLKPVAAPNVTVETNAKETNVKVEGKNPVNVKVENEPELKPIDSPTKVEEDFSAPKKDAVKEVKIDEDELEANLGQLEEKQYTGRLISLDLQDTDIDNALRIIAEVSNLNIIASDDVTGKVTLRLVDVPWDQALDVILKTNGLDKVQDGNVVRIAPVDKLKAEREALKQAVQAEDELEPLKVNYVRVSYAKAAELQPLVETVLTERGTVTYDERTNQLIVKDIDKGLKNVGKLVQKLDLRTPQVLIETQIVEAQRKFVRELGSELSFSSIQSPETGNALGYNFPNSAALTGSALDSAGNQTGSASFFPSGDQSSALSLVLGSADGSKSLGLRLSQGEKDGMVKVVSRPSVAVTNNQPAVIKSVEKIRIKMPQGGGLTVNQGQGAGGAGGAGAATETIEVGIVLNVTAQASPDYFVLMDIEAKSSTLGVKDRGVDGIPPEIERSATSSVLVSSGQTFAMGGIYRISEDDSVAGVPFLKDIPFLGQFFRKTTVADTDEELIFFITPRIIEGSFDDAAMKSVS